MIDLTDHVFRRLTEAQSRSIIYAPPNGWRRYWPSGLQIPRGRSGAMRIRYMPIEEGTLIYCRPPNEHWRADRDFTATVLEESTGVFDGEETWKVWMSDTPNELMTQMTALRYAKGRVLVAGLGLGWISRLLAQKPGVESVDIIEQSQDVINLVWEHVRLPNMNLVVGDAVEVLHTLKGQKYDLVYMDIWPNFSEKYLPLFRMTRRFCQKFQIVKPGRPVVCWGEPEARRLAEAEKYRHADQGGHIRQALAAAFGMEGGGSVEDPGNDPDSHGGRLPLQGAAGLEQGRGA
jgi:protein-L-isoaspartate O-methyltransferase